ncbi:MAG: hypothetical protein ACREPI_02225 [Candidatus Dormibacterales bacterium]
MLGGLAGAVLVLSAAVFVWRPTEAIASPGVAQSFGAANTALGTSLTASTGTHTSVGDLLVATIRIRSTTGLTVVGGVSDGTGDVWHQAATVTSGSQGDNEIWYAANAGSVSGVTVSVASPAALAMTVVEVTGASGSPLDGAASAQGNSSTASTGATGTTTQASEVVVADVGWNADRTVSGQTAGYTTTATEQSTASNTHTGQQAAWQVLSAVGSQSYSATLSSSVPWTGVIATFD